MYFTVKSGLKNITSTALQNVRPSNKLAVSQLATILYYNNETNLIIVAFKNINNKPSSNRTVGEMFTTVLVMKPSTFGLPQPQPPPPPTQKTKTGLLKAINLFALEQSIVVRPGLNRSRVFSFDNYHLLSPTPRILCFDCFHPHPPPTHPGNHHAKPTGHIFQHSPRRTHSDLMENVSTSSPFLPRFRLELL